MSLILRPIRVGMPVLATAYAAVSVCQAIETTAEKAPQIKWVNDVFLEKKKVCGILTEAVTDNNSGNVQWMVIGIGVNFITPSTGYPEEIKDIAGSVFSGGQPIITRNQLAAEIVNRVLSYDGNIGSNAILAEYKMRLMGIGKKVNITGLAEPFEATVIDIDEIGQLVVKKDNNEILSIAAGEISMSD